MPRWTLVLTELNGTAIGELRNVNDRRVYLGVNRLPTLSGRARLDNVFADRLLACNVLVKAYRDGVLRFIGPVVAAEEVSDGAKASVAFNAAGALWRLGHRLIGKSTTGYSNGTALAPVDRGTIIGNIIGTVNGDAHTGVAVGTVAPSTTTYVAYAPYKGALEAVNELVNALDGPDLEQLPQEPTTLVGGVPVLYTVNVLAALGQSRPAAVFEYGVGRRNVAQYKRQVTVETMLNAGYGLPGSAEPGAAAVTASDASSITTYGRLEGTVPTADLVTPALRQALVDEHVRVRKVPRQIITFQPTRDDPAAPGRVPQFGVDFHLGDAIPFRAVMRQDGQLVTRVNASLRVYAVTFDLDAEGLETPTLTLTPD